jgi:hypothetical protein
MTLIDADGRRSPQASLFVRRIRQIESTTGRVLLGLGAFLLVSFLFSAVVGIANSNLFWSESNQYGRVSIPGHRKVHLPSGKVQINVAVVLPGRSTQIPELLLPSISLNLVPPPGVEEPTIERSLGETQNALDKYADTQRRVAYAHVATAGTYLVVAKGNFTGYGLNPALWFGYEEAPVHGWVIWFIGMGLAALVFVGAGVVWWLRRRRRPPDDGELRPGNDGELPPTSYSSRQLREYEEHPH